MLSLLHLARHQGGCDRELRYPDRRINRMGSIVVQLLPTLAYLMAISLATLGVARLIDGAPHSSVAACVTSGFRPLVSTDIQGTAEFCASTATARAGVYVSQLQPRGTYTTLLVYHPNAGTTFPTVYALDRGPRTLPTWTVQVDTSNADQYGWLQASQEIPALSLAHGSAVQLVLMEFVRGPASPLGEATRPADTRHRADPIPGVDTDTPVAAADLQVP
jgi:hypothetical protein